MAMDAFVFNQLMTKHLATLNLEVGVSDADIKTAYYKLAKKWHPDKNNGDPDATEKYHKINQAYEWLDGNVVQKPRRVRKQYVHIHVRAHVICLHTHTHAPHRYTRKIMY
jgi:DnaJ-class molecular chaperone